MSQRFVEYSYIFSSFGEYEKQKPLFMEKAHRDSEVEDWVGFGDLKTAK